MRPMRRALLTVGLLAPLCRGLAQSPASLADLRWSAAETSAGRFVIVPGKRSFVGGYNTPGLEIWTYPLQLVRHYWVSFRLEGDTSDVDGRVALRTIEQTPTGATRVYTAPGIALRERVFTPVDLPAATISYAAESSRPVLITVGATVLALFPLAMHGGPLWQPLCYAQIGGLTVATFITLLMVPVLYSICVLDLKILTWEAKPKSASESSEAALGQVQSTHAG